jgi:GAF domain-containing protein
LIGKRFGVYHTGVFLIDDSREYAILYASNSEGGRRMLANGYRVKVGGQGIVSSVTATGNPRIALDLGMDSVYFENSFLPDSHSEVALPLKIAGETIGVLDLQSPKLDAFVPEDVEVLSILANQLAIAIQNARSFESAREAVQEAETAYQQLTGETWSRFTKGQMMLGYHFDGVETRSITAGTKQTTTATTLQVPVRLRGREIGKLKLTSLRSDRIWSEDEVLMTESIAERAALSLENARLLEDAHRRASREHVISEISARVSSSTDMEEILRNAVQELGHRMGGAEVVLELGANFDTEKAE